MEYIHAALLLHKLGREINEENLKKIVAAAGIQADESKIKSLVASLKGVNIDKELENASLTLASTGAPTASAASKEEKKETVKEEKREAAVEGLAALFG